MTYFVRPNSRIAAPLPRRDIMAICAYLNRDSTGGRTDTRNTDDAESLLNRLAAAAGMQ